MRQSHFNKEIATLLNSSQWHKRIIMSRKVKSGLIQMSLPMTEGEGTIKEIMDAMYDKHIPFIEEAGRQGVQILCLQ